MAQSRVGRISAVAVMASVLLGASLAACRPDEAAPPTEQTAAESCDAYAAAYEHCASSSGAGESSTSGLRASLRAALASHDGGQTAIGDSCRRELEKLKFCTPKAHGDSGR
ncbi:hypothetical protein BH09MYX1_BH09MYX1_33770 [soil metagenome]